MTRKTCAAIDFGTNTARLLIAEQTAAGLEPVLVEREIVRLGGGFSDEHGIARPAFERGITCLKKFAAILADHDIRQVKASATSAVRDAVNGADFVKEVLVQSGILLEVLDGETEALLTLRGALSALDHQADRVVVLDVGGGSTELIFACKEQPLFVRSLPLGVVRLTEGFVNSDAMTGRTEKIISAILPEIRAAGIENYSGYELVCTAGTATTIAAIKLALVNYDYRLVNNFRVSRADVGEIYNRLVGLSPAERLLVPGLEPGREDLIIAGLIVTMNVMDTFGFNCFTTSDFGLLEGLALAGSEGFGKNC